MAVAKKKASKKIAKKTSAKKAAPTGRLGSLKKSSKKLVDQVLVRMSPQLQSKVDQLIQNLEVSREGRMGDLSLLAGKILIRAQEISKSLRQMKKPSGSKK